MMGALHRQNRLVQLNLSANVRERRPELAVGASEPQLRGYATLVSAKLPLILGVKEMARLANEHLTWMVNDSPERDDRTELENAELENQLSRLDGQLLHWNMLLADLETNVDSLQSTIEHAWMDRMLYEQEQLRSEQELAAEIERSRQSRPTGQRPGRFAYNLVMMLLAAAAVVVTVTTAKDQLDQPRPWWAVVLLLWPVWLVAVLAFGVFPLFGQFRRAAKEKQGVLLAYPYEFAFRLDEDVDAKKLRDYIRSNEHRELPTDLLGTLFVTTRGIGRIERMSTDTTVAKLHSAVAFRMGWQYARFEVISEVLIHKIGLKMQHVLLQCRIFGEAPEGARTRRADRTAEGHPGRSGQPHR